MKLERIGRTLEIVVHTVSSKRPQYCFRKTLDMYILLRPPYDGAKIVDTDT